MCALGHTLDKPFNEIVNSSGFMHSLLSKVLNPLSPLYYTLELHKPPKEMCKKNINSSCYSLLYFTLYLVLYLIHLVFLWLRFWYVRCTMQTCWGCWAAGAKISCSQNWALSCSHEQGLLLDGLFCSSILEAQ